jgi:hypothetical protein
MSTKEAERLERRESEAEGTRSAAEDVPTWAAALPTHCRPLLYGVRVRSRRSSGGTGSGT